MKTALHIALVIIGFLHVRSADAGYDPNVFDYVTTNNGILNISGNTYKEKYSDFLEIAIDTNQNGKIDKYDTFQIEEVHRKFRYRYDLSRFRGLRYEVTLWGSKVSTSYPSEEMGGHTRLEYGVFDRILRKTGVVD